MQKGDLIALEFRLRNIRLLTKLGFGGSEKREFLPLRCSKLEDQGWQSKVLGEREADAAVGMEGAVFRFGPVQWDLP